MIAKFSRSWALFKQSWAVLRSDKTLVVLPILSSIAALLVLATFAIPLALSVDWAAVQSSAESAQGGKDIHQHVQPWHYVVLFFFYFANFFVITFFNSALVACAIAKFKGEPSSVSDGLKLAVNRLPQILAWSAVAATVGVLLQMIQERLGVVGKIIINLIGMLWTIATFFVVPVLVVEKVGPFDAIKRSVGILKKTWGETLVSNLGLSAVTMLIAFAGILVLAGAIAASIALQTVWIAAIAGAIFLIAMIALALITSTLKGILLAATYQYAATGVIPEGFDADVLQNAFTLKGKK